VCVHMCAILAIQRLKCSLVIHFWLTHPPTQFVKEHTLYFAAASELLN